MSGDGEFGPIFLFDMQYPMLVLRFFTLCIVTLMFAGCGREPGVPLAFHLTEQKEKGVTNIPEGEPDLVVTQVEYVLPEQDKHTITIKLLPADAIIFEKLTYDNVDKTAVIHQGSNILAAVRIREPISRNAGLTIPISTNVNFNSVYWNLEKLSK